MNIYNLDPLKPKLVLLDVYQTLLDMSEVERRVNALMSDKRGYNAWFELLMQYGFVEDCTVPFRDFQSIATETMQMAGKSMGKTIDSIAIDPILEMLRHLPVHDGVPEGLSALYAKGFRTAALTNSPQEIVLSRMERTGLISYFEQVLSAESFEKYKPCVEVYHWAADEVKVNTSDILLVSSHWWDIGGGAKAGMKTAYLENNKQLQPPAGVKPNITFRNLVALANQLASAATGKDV